MLAPRNFEKFRNSKNNFANSQLLTLKDNSIYAKGDGQILF